MLKKTIILGICIFFFLCSYLLFQQSPQDTGATKTDSFNKLIAFPEQYKEVIKNLDEEVSLLLKELRQSL